MKIELEQVVEAYRRIATISYYQKNIVVVLIDVICGLQKVLSIKRQTAQKNAKSYKTIYLY